LFPTCRHGLKAPTFKTTMTFLWIGISTFMVWDLIFVFMNLCVRCFNGSSILALVLCLVIFTF
jgi:hypothetical protein